VKHVAPGHSPKALALRQTVRAQFQAGKDETDPTKVENLKSSAIRALSNYMLYQSAQKEPLLEKAMNDQIRSVKNETKNKNKGDR
jgi:hypothetical protein